MTKLVKFSAGDFNSPEIEYDYGNVFELAGSSLKVSASKKQVELLAELIKDLVPPFYVLYVLVVSRTGKELGRYQSPIFESETELLEFLTKFKSFFETDGRHHIWIGTVENNGLLVYDQHNVIFAYGDNEKYIKRLIENEYAEKSFSFPAPHVHSFHEENDKFEIEMFHQFDWQFFPLKENDTYDE